MLNNTKDRDSLFFFFTSTKRDGDVTKKEVTCDVRDATGGSDSHRSGSPPLLLRSSLVMERLLP